MRTPSRSAATSILIFCAKDSASSRELALRADSGRNLDVAAGLTVEPDAAELVIDAHGLAGAERHRLLKILRTLVACAAGLAAFMGFAVKSSIARGADPATACENATALSGKRLDCESLLFSLQKLPRVCCCFS